MTYYSEEGEEVTAAEKIEELESTVANLDRYSDLRDAQLQSTRSAFKQSPLLAGVGAPIVGAALARFLPDYPKVAGLDTDLAIGGALLALLALRKDRDVADNYQAHALLEGAAAGSLAVWAYRSSQK